MVLTGLQRMGSNLKSSLELSRRHGIKKSFITAGSGIEEHDCCRSKYRWFASIYLMPSCGHERLTTRAMQLLRTWILRFCSLSAFWSNYWCASSLLHLSSEILFVESSIVSNSPDSNANCRFPGFCEDSEKIISWKSNILSRSKSGVTCIQAHSRS